MNDGNSSGARILNPASTAAIVLGAHDWTEAGLGRAPSFLRSAKGILSYFYNKSGIGFDPELILDLFDDPTPASDQLARIWNTIETRMQDRRKAGCPLTDILVYYIGHGITDDHGQLSLLVRRSHRGLEAESGIKASDLARTLRLAAPLQRRLIVLDCCFSEAAAKSFIGMSGDLNVQVAATAAKSLGEEVPERGTILLCSSPVGEISIGAPNAERTLFTGAALDVLMLGVPGKPPILSFADLRDAAFERMVQAFGGRAPRPALHQVNAAKGDLTRLPVFPNRAIAKISTSQSLIKDPPELTNRYLIEGINPDGSRYRGSLTLAPHGESVWDATWHVGADTFPGLGVSNARVLAIAYQHGGALGCALYTRNENGTLSGVWALSGFTGLATEQLTPDPQVSDTRH